MSAAEVVFGDDYDEDGFKLVELPEDVCSALTSGEKVYIVGDAVQRAVLCTPTQSFNLVKEDQSNLRLLVDSTTWDDAASQAPVAIRGCSVYHYELTEKPLDVSQLKSLLMETPWTKEWCLMTRRSDSPINKKKRSNLYTLDELMDRLQHSSHEVRQILQQLHAIEIDGFWRIVDPAYAQDVMNQVLDVFVQQDWDFDRTLTVDELESHLSITPAILAHCLRNYSSSIAEDGSFSLDAVKIATFQAISLFDERKEWPVDEFMEKWSFRVPDGVSIDASMLRGLAILRQDTLVYFPEDRLSIDAKTRFQEIFSFQPKWTLAQLEPYLTQLISGKMTQASLLLKYTRASRVLNSTERLYSKR